MFRRPAILFIPALVAFGCSKDHAKETPPAKKPAEPRPEPKRGPCANDGECELYLDPCSCACQAVVELPPAPPNSTWSTFCGGSPPGNCGVASPCMNKTAVCDAVTKTCRISVAPTN